VWREGGVPARLLAGIAARLTCTKRRGAMPGQVTSTSLRVADAV